MRWNGTNEDLSGAGFSFCFTFLFHYKNILYQRGRINALGID
jgi:hypothetical protein